MSAYQRTRYCCFEPSLEIRIGRCCPQLDELLSADQQNEWAYITAFNPFSQVLSEDENRARHLELLHLVAAYPIFEGEGVGEDPSWKSERSVLIMGITRDAAAAIGKRFEQNAIVVGAKGNPAELLVLV